MSNQEWFEFRVTLAAEQAREAGFEGTYLALLDVLRSSRCSDERIIGSLDVPLPSLVRFVDAENKWRQTLGC